MENNMKEDCKCNKIIKTKADFIALCKETNMPQDVFHMFEGTDFLIFINEYERIIDNLKLTNVKTYSYALTGPRLFNYYIGYFVDLHKVVLKVNRNSLKAERSAEWWTERVESIMRSVAKWLKRILYMNEYEKREHLLSRMRAELDAKGIQYCDDEDYQRACQMKLKYEDD